MRLSLNPFHTGFWVASNLCDFYEPAASMSSWWKLAWTTRRVAQYQLKYWCSEESRQATPCVETWLRRADIYPWIGRMYTVYCTEVHIRIHNAGGGPVTFHRRCSFGSYDDALDDFKAHGHRLRWGLATRQTRP